MKIRLLFWFLFSLFTALVIYGRSLSYEFVYDDHWRVEQNESIRSLKNIPRFFFDRTTAASVNQPDLHRDSFRPWSTLSYALDYFLFGPRPWGYRLHNILLHAIIAFLLLLVGMEVLQLSWGAAASASLLFLFHPMNVGVVVWIAERTSLLCMTFMLLGLLTWTRFTESESKKMLWLAHIFFGTALLSREIAVVFPFLLLLKPPMKKKMFIHPVIMLFVFLLYMIVRRRVLGQTAISPYWGGSLFTNLINTTATIPLYVKKILWPFPLRLTYADIPILQDINNHQFWYGLGFLAATICLVVTFWKKENRLSRCLILMALFWLPGSNIIPLTTLFAERLLYPLVFVACFIIGIIWDRCWRFSRVTLTMATFLLILCCGVGTVRAIPVWKNDIVLWEHETRVSPQSWFAWACAADAEYRHFLKKTVWIQGQREQELNRIEKNVIQALALGPPIDTASALFFLLSDINVQLHQNKAAAEYRRRAVILQAKSNV